MDKIAHEVEKTIEQLSTESMAIQHSELAEMQLAFVGGGIGDTVL